VIFYKTAIFFAKIRPADQANDNHIGELCRIFVKRGKQDPSWIISDLVTFLVEYKDRYDRREISGSTIRYYVKVCQSSQASLGEE